MSVGDLTNNESYIKNGDDKRQVDRDGRTDLNPGKYVCQIRINGGVGCRNSVEEKMRKREKGEKGWSGFTGCLSIHSGTSGILKGAVYTYIRTSSITD